MPRIYTYIKFQSNDGHKEVTIFLLQMSPPLPAPIEISKILMHFPILLWK